MKAKPDEDESVETEVREVAYTLSPWWLRGFFMTGRWFLSKTVRQLSEMCRQMERVINEQRDLLTPEAIAALGTARTEAREAIRSGANKGELKRQMGKLEEAAPGTHPI